MYLITTILEWRGNDLLYSYQNIMSTLPIFQVFTKGQLVGKTNRRIPSLPNYPICSSLTSAKYNITLFSTTQGQIYNSEQHMSKEWKAVSN